VLETGGTVNRFYFLYRTFCADFCLLACSSLCLWSCLLSITAQSVQNPCYFTSHLRHQYNKIHYIKSIKLQLVYTSVTHAARSILCIHFASHLYHLRLPVSSPLMLHRCQPHRVSSFFALWLPSCGHHKVFPQNRI
jgi:hypothetical protein